MALRIKKDDIVVLTLGKGKRTKANPEKGKGKVLRILNEKNRAIVEGLHRVKRHMKPTKASPQGGIIEKEASISLSNLLPYCSKCDKGVRVGFKVEGEKKTRVCKKCGSTIGK